MEAAVTTALEPVKRSKKNPSYVVLEQMVSGEVRILDEGVKAPSRKAAIAHVTDNEGTFIVIPEKEWQTLTRKTRSQIVDEFE